MANVLEDYTLLQYGDVKELKIKLMSETMAEAVMMTGSGPTVFALFSRLQDAAKGMCGLQETGIFGILGKNDMKMSGNGGKKMLNLDLQNHRPLREIVYEELKRQILVGEIPPGTRMMEVELADEMGVSRTPIREAIRKLEKEGLVTIEPRRAPMPRTYP